MSKLLKSFRPHSVGCSECIANKVCVAEGRCNGVATGIKFALIVIAGVLLGSLASNSIVVQPSLVLLQEVNTSKKYGQRLDNLEQDVEQIRSEIKTLKEHHTP